MKALGIRTLRANLATVLKDLPVSVTSDGESVAVILSLNDYQRLVTQYGVHQPTTTEPPIYNKAIHKPGDRVRVWKGKKLVETIVPELDADGHEMTDRWD